MTKKQVSEIFALWALNWPTHEMFQGGRELLNARISLYASALADTDYWTAMQAAQEALTRCRFPPTVSEMSESVKRVREQVDAAVNDSYLRARDIISLIPILGDSVIDRLDQDCAMVIRDMGGIDAFCPPDKPMFNFYGYRASYLKLLTKQEKLTDGGKLLLKERN